MSRTLLNFASGTLLLMAAAALPAQQPQPNHTPPSMGAMMQQVGAMQQRMDGVSAQMMQGGSASMGGMSGMMGMTGMGHSHAVVGQMATHMTQMLAAMQGYMTQMQALMRDSAVDRNPAMMKNLQELQRHMGSMLTTMAPMIGTMQQMQQHMGAASPVRKP